MKTYDYNLCKLSNPAQETRLINIIRANPDRPDEAIQIRLVTSKLKCDYYALSWCWSTYKKEAEQPLVALAIVDDHDTYVFKVSANLAAAIRMLYKHQIETIWIDWICINQQNVEERSNQVQLMASIYGSARKVIVWLGQKANGSDIAMKFIPSLLNLQRFAKLIKDSASHSAWDAMKSLMMRDWFQRRWIIQEIALAKEAEIFCGDDRLDWRDFADAISLFNLSESNNRVISDIMKGQSDYSHIPDFFGSIAALGAARLVEVTDNLFLSGTGSHDLRPRLQNLEHLVSTFTPFKATEARDIIYAVLAIAKDSAPRTESQLRTVLPTDVQSPAQSAFTTDDILKKSRSFGNILKLFTSIIEGPLASKSYNVDYSLPISDVFVEFVRFCIKRAMTSDPTRALDIICRPWAPDPDFLRPGDSNPAHGHWRAKYTKKLGYDGKAQKDNDYKHVLQSPRKPAAMHYDPDRDPRQPKPATLADADTLPSWIPSVEQSAFGWYDGESGPRMTRQYPDSLVGETSFEKRPYAASGSRRVTAALRFEDGVIEDPGNESINNTHYHSLYVEGFILGTVDQLGERSQNGQIPKGWSDLVDCSNKPDIENVEEETLWDRPEVDDFWRTLVGNRGLASVNPPRCYRRILSIAYTGVKDVNLDDYIFYSKHDPAKALSRRIHAVIWDRRLIKVKKCARIRASRGYKERNIGLAPSTTNPNDLVCILYGCSVPVILRKYEKSENVIRSQREQQARKTIFTAVRTWFYRRRLEKVIIRWRLLERIFHCCMRVWFLFYQRDKLRVQLKQSRDQFTQASIERLKKNVASYTIRLWCQRFRLNAAQRALRQPEGKEGAQTLATPRNEPVPSTKTSSMPPSPSPHKRPATEDTAPSYVARRQRRRSTVTPKTPSRKERSDGTETPTWCNTYPDCLQSDEMALEPPKANIKFFYKLIGECYVHRMMDGDATDYQAEEKLPKVLFEIR